MQSELCKQPLSSIELAALVSCSYVLISVELNISWAISNLPNPEPGAGNGGQVFLGKVCLLRKYGDVYSLIT